MSRGKFAGVIRFKGVNEFQKLTLAELIIQCREKCLTLTLSSRSRRT